MGVTLCGHKSPLHLLNDTTNHTKENGGKPTSLSDVYSTDGPRH